MLEIRAESARTSIESQVERGTLRSSPTDATDNGDLLAENIQAPVWRPQPTVGYFDVSRQEKSFFGTFISVGYE